jgi:hypothetical protein
MKKVLAHDDRSFGLPPTPIRHAGGGDLPR